MRSTGTNLSINLPGPVRPNDRVLAADFNALVDAVRALGSAIGGGDSLLALAETLRYFAVCTVAEILPASIPPEGVPASTLQYRLRLLGSGPSGATIGPVASHWRTVAPDDTVTRARPLVAVNDPVLCFRAPNGSGSYGLRPLIPEALVYVDCT